MTASQLSLSRRGFISAASLTMLAACGKRAGSDTGPLYAGDQKGGSKAVLAAAGKLTGLPYRIESSAFPNAAPLLEHSTRTRSTPASAAIPPSSS